MENTGLDTKQFAVAMGETLTILRWDAKIDAAGVEFVLGGSSSSINKPLPSSEELRRLGWNTSNPCAGAFGSEAAVTHLWLLDFNVDQAVKRFLGNDPYYPRPSPP